MARSYAKLLVEIWDPTGDFRDLTEGAQRLYMMLISHPQLTAAGVIPLQSRRWAGTAKDLTERKVERYLAELEAHPSRKVLIDRDTEEVLVRAFIRRDGGANNPNIGKAIRGAINNIESKGLRRYAEKEWTRATRRSTEDPPPDPSEDPGEDDAEEAGQATSPHHTSTSSLPPQPATRTESATSLRAAADDFGKLIKGTFSTVDGAAS